ncbi:AraC-type DNA-binding protein [Paracoccus alcaliphilus]|uniref:AraC-type DNA-binding protein n=1 Tax=Paracoccus alcaliphilus TaxID=34002 RepID=A0A1H8NPX6_9RHOB|nr:AraC family transcriptional regulator [Paracoccus alcaliphilus]WCR19665.1 AraC family transcriptional regulator [Paracoccus alcaliphilus]SEO31630.1 AraC-type DNA-binding protein [Paracoccus alcaliphilus]
MPDPLTQVIELLRPQAVFSKGISGAGAWAVRYVDFGRPAFAAMTLGSCRLAVEGEDPVVVEEGDFVLLPATPTFSMSSLAPAPVQRINARSAPPQHEVRHGRQDGPPEMRQVGGWFTFGMPDAALLVTLLARMIHIRGVPRLTQLVRMLGDEAARDEVGSELILERLVEILLIEALRAAPARATHPGLLRGLADPRIASALRGLHGDITRPWTIPDLAGEASMSRSAFIARFTRMVGSRPIEYLTAWRMAVARDLLRRGGIALNEVAAKVGYGSASTFSTAFSRHTGQPPGRFMKAAVGEE